MKKFDNFLPLSEIKKISEHYQKPLVSEVSLERKLKMKKIIDFLPLSLNKELKMKKSLDFCLLNLRNSI